jgi:SAM-dependent methyltransferase
MDLKEANELSIINERQHWWIKTRFLYIDKLFKPIQKGNLCVAEYGCGTGQNLWYLKEEFNRSSDIEKAIGVDPNLPSDFRPEWINDKFKLSNNLDEFKKEEADVVLAMDVLEHVDNDTEALTHWVSTMKPDGRILVTVPAFQSLWSYHDEFLEHKKRYTRKSLLSVAKEAGLRPVYLKYSFSYIFPIMYILRKLKKNATAKQDLKLPNPIINSLMLLVGKLEYLLGGHRLIGTSVIGIFEKDE